MTTITPWFTSRYGTGYHDYRWCPLCERVMVVRPDGKFMHHKPPKPAAGRFASGARRNEPIRGADWCATSNTRPDDWYTDGE